ncbi:Heterotrimeric G-protein alpha subunit [Mycena sanguinolenta]|uniref:Heterotrimeric G-protein alpha subunit n=1 Tax=Mycena sanguinolenta TaxID=230812 RepID=A0A8H6YSM1_9AGAR|nr:Heterotrimeric G-protein alpha subunit [Mycena sanguinolenta]
MGACTSQSDRASKSRSDEIDRQLGEDSKRYRKECRILLLGSGESGKSTIMKQMKIIHQSAFTEEERLAYRKTIHKNVLDSAQALVEAIRKYGMEDLLRDKLVCETILPATDGSSQGQLTPTGNEAQAGEGQDGLGRELVDAIEMLWTDPVVARVLDKHQSKFYLMDTSSPTSRVSPTPSYIPTEEDVLRARAQSTAITETRFNVGNMSIHMFDVGGQRTERRKWIHYFERCVLVLFRCPFSDTWDVHSVTSIIFCTALSEYNQVLLEEKGKVRFLFLSSHSHLSASIRLPCPLFTLRDEVS